MELTMIKVRLLTSAATGCRSFMRGVKYPGLANDVEENAAIWSDRGQAPERIMTTNHARREL